MREGREGEALLSPDPTQPTREPCSLFASQITYQAGHMTDVTSGLTCPRGSFRGSHRPGQAWTLGRRRPALKPGQPGSIGPSR